LLRWWATAILIIFLNPLKKSLG